MDDKKKLLKESFEKIDVPESLLPENIEKKLNAADEADSKNKTGVVRLLAMAATVALVVIAGFGVHRVMTPDDAYDTASTDPSEVAADSEADANKDSGANADENITAKTDEDSVVIDGVMHSAKDYDEITAFVEKAKEQYEDSITIGIYGGVMKNGDDMELSAIAGSAAVDSAAAESAEESAEDSTYSDTNVRTEGVDEGDIVKTDGSYIYQRTDSNNVRIVELDNGKMKELATISPAADKEAYVRELYVDSDRLIIICEVYETQLSNIDGSYETQESESDGPVSNYSYVRSTQSVQVITYDISDRKSPREKGTVSIDGYYRSSRYTDGYVYVMTSYGEPIMYYCYNGYSDDISTDEIIPKVNGKDIDAKDIMLPEEVKNEPFCVITGIDAENPSEVTCTKAVMGYVDNMYVSAGSIYFYSLDYSGSYEKTVIVKFSYDKGQIAPKCATSVKGSIDDSFCIDENEDGSLRVATTVWNDDGELESSLYVYDKNLKKTGSIVDFAGNEGVKSCRFVGDVGFVVTFRNTDPLFAIDLSDPYDPKIISELTLPGFSEYLHLWSDGLLFGMGFNADEETGGTENIKLSMFDISNLAKTKEVAKKSIDADDADVLYGNYKSLLISPDKGIIGFQCYDYGDEKNDWETTGYYNVYTYSEKSKSFGLALSIKLDDAFGSTARGLFSGDYFYLIESGRITSYSMPDFEKVSRIR